MRKRDAIISMFIIILSNSECTADLQAGNCLWYGFLPLGVSTALHPTACRKSFSCRI